MLKNFYGNFTVNTLTLLSLIISFCIALVDYKDIILHMPVNVFIFVMVWLGISIIFAFIIYREFVCGFLICLFAMMVAWRIAAIYDVRMITMPLISSFILLLCNFIYCAWINLKQPTLFLHQISLEGWQLVFVRMYIGFNFIPHFAEKLFAGTLPYMQDVNAFSYLGVPYPAFFVLLAGCCELAAAIALSLGFFMRLGAIGAALYLIIATYLGHHFSLGFIWAGIGGGWEFATMWIIFILCFAITGAHQFSIDQRLEDKFKLPKFIHVLM
jgi:putative oxidoreductase